MTQPLYTVIGTFNSRALRVIWMMEELGQPYELVPALPHAEEIRAVNPSGKIPALKIGHEVLFDSVAITQYLADSHHRFTYPAGSLERAIQDGFTQFCVDEVEGALWTAGKHSFVLPEERRIKDVKETARWEFDRALDALARRLGENEYVMGAEFTVPDLLLGHCAGWARAAKFELPQDGPLPAYFKRLRDRPAFRRAIERGKAAHG